MDVTINYLAVFVCTALSIVIGSIWYGPLFGKKWMEFYGKKDATKEEIEKMQKEARPLYFIQFILSFLQLYVLAWFIGALENVSSGVYTVFGIYVGFVFTIVAGSALWIGDSYKTMREKVLIQGGYQLVFMLISGYILSVWK